jgi:hypothetical protein
VTNEGRPSDLSAAKLGVSGKTGDKLADVVDAVDVAEAEGDYERVERHL